MKFLTSIRGHRLALGPGGELLYEKRGIQQILPLQTPVVVTASTLTVSKDAHVNRLVVLNRALGIAVTLPAATGTGDTYTFMVGIAISGGSTTITSSGTDYYCGLVSSATTTFGANDIQAAGGTNHVLTMNGGTTGGLVGSWVCFQDALAGYWYISGRLIGSGTLATSLS